MYELEEIKAIETIYNGYRFRSRLEARWAVFFDEANIEYEYEPEGFIGYCGAKYLPDFYLPKFDTYAEVKGSDGQLKRDWDKIVECIDYNSTPISQKGLIILGRIPLKAGCIPCFPFLTWYKGVVSGLCVFDVWDGKGKFYEPRTETRDYEYYRDSINYGITEYMDYAGDLGRISESYITTNPQYVGEEETVFCSDSEYVNRCYKAARSARFEHGERRKFKSIVKDVDKIGK